MANLVKGAKKIANPLTEESERAELLPKYLALTEMIEEYRIRTYLEACPSNQQSYIKMKLIEED